MRVTIALLTLLAFTLQLMCAPVSDAQQPTEVGPFNATFLAGGIGLSQQLESSNPIVMAGSSWSLTGWLRPTFAQHQAVILASLGDIPRNPSQRLRLDDGEIVLQLSDGTQLQTHAKVQIAKWQAIAITYDGATARVFLDGREVGTIGAKTQSVAPLLQIAPAQDAAGQNHFGGSWANLELRSGTLSTAAILQWSRAPPNFDLIVFHNVGVGWPWQQKAWRGLQVPQDAWTLPHAKTPPSIPVAQPLRAESPLQAEADRTWQVSAWRLQMANKTVDDGARLSDPQYEDRDWYAATVPGTILTTLIDRGVYPDPSYGLNNLAIPESLARQKYWYRSTFVTPQDFAHHDVTLIFNGINYLAEVWLNGVSIGKIEGAFTRGQFQIAKYLKVGARNALAVRISPPPHPGIPHEESIAAGPGENGGNLAIDGPTFIASEGWDWIPGIRDRNSGLWQSVQLKVTDRLRLLDAHIVTEVADRNDRAAITIEVPVENSSTASQSAIVTAEFEGVSVHKAIEVEPGVTEVRFSPHEFPQLNIEHPKLWWPNGYGKANLYALKLSVANHGAVADTSTTRFGIRQITYELSLFDSSGRLRRVVVDPTLAGLRNERLVDVRHEAIKQTPNGWAASLTATGEVSPAVRDIDTQSLSPYLVIRVNGVPIAARGGSWGTDDARKRISRARLEPYFKLHKDANLNIIRNWLGQDTEPVFYDLADEYGLLVLNDFWESTQDFQVEAQDPQLFLANARDTILRYRNHPSIALWFGRNEGVPQPIINEGLDTLVATLDGTRYYTGSSNSINLQGSGPYNYRPPAQYFTELARGFSVEVGSPSLSTLESLQATIPEADRWPISDTLAYHDWHFGGNGDVKTFMQTLATRFGAASSLQDFERKAQLMNYETYRAIFEGFQAHLWAQNSGRLLWMTHPSWPSNAWQIYSSDYDTHAAYYGVKKAIEPLHAQLNLPDFKLAVVNTTLQMQGNLRLRSRVLTLDNRVLLDKSQRVDARANAVTTLPALELQQSLAQEGVVAVELMMYDQHGHLIDKNIYWQARDDASYRKLNMLPMQRIELLSKRSEASDEATSDEATSDQEVIEVTLHNRGNAPALSLKLTMFDDAGKRVLPVYYSDNYLTLLPGESQTVTISCPAQGARCTHLKLRGWNTPEQATEILSR